MRFGEWQKAGLVGVFLIIAASNPVAIKAALVMGWPPMSLGLLRMGFIGLFFFAWAGLLREHPLGPAGKARRWALLSAVSKGIAVLCFYLALTIIPANRAVILSTVGPIINLALVHLILEQERVRQRHVAGIGLTFLGMLLVLLLRPQAETAIAEPNYPLVLGDAAMIASVVFHQSMIVFEKRALLLGTNPRQLIVTTSMLSVSVFGLMVFLVGERLGDVPAGGASLGVFLYLVTLAGVVLFFYRRWLVSVLEVTYLNSFAHVGKALAILGATLFLRERLPLESLLGFGLIVFGTIVAAGAGREMPASIGTGTDPVCGAVPGVIDQRGRASESGD